MNNFFDLYHCLIDGIDTTLPVTETLCGTCWTAVQTPAHFGMAMTTPVDTAPRMLSGDYRGMELKKLAQLKADGILTEEEFIPDADIPFLHLHIELRAPREDIFSDKFPVILHRLKPS